MQNDSGAPKVPGAERALQPPAGPEAIVTPPAPSDISGGDTHIDPLMQEPRWDSAENGEATELPHEEDRHLPAVRGVGHVAVIDENAAQTETKLFNDAEGIERLTDPLINHLFVPAELLPFVSSFTEHPEKEGFWADPALIEKATEDKLLFEGAVEKSAGEIIAHDEGIAAEIAEKAREMSVDFLIDERQRDQALESDHLYPRAQFLNYIYGQLVVEGLETDLLVGDIQREEIFNRPAMRNALGKARILYEHQMQKSGQTATEFGAETDADLRLRSGAIEQYAVELISFGMKSEFTKLKEQREAEKAKAEESAAPGLFKRNLGKFAVWRRGEKFVPVEARIEEIEENTETEKLAYDELSDEAIGALRSITYNITGRTSTLATSNDLANDRLIYANHNRIDATRDTLIRFGATNDNFKEIVDGIERKHEGYYITGDAGGFDHVTGEPTLRTVLLRQSGSQRARPDGSKKNPQTGEEFEKATVVMLHETIPGEGGSPTIIELQHDGSDGEMRSAAETRYRVVADQLTYPAFSKAQKLWNEFCALKGLVPVTDELTVIENDQQSTLQGLPDMLALQAAKRREWELNRDGNPPLLSSVKQGNVVDTTAQ